MTRAEAEQAIADLVAHGSDDEVRVLGVIAHRLGEGHAAYGPLRVRRDPRDFRREAADEALDGMAYLAMALLRDDDEPEAGAAARPERGQT